MATAACLVQMQFQLDRPGGRTPTDDSWRFDLWGLAHLQSLFSDFLDCAQLQQQVRFEAPCWSSLLAIPALVPKIWPWLDIAVVATGVACMRL